MRDQSPRDPGDILAQGAGRGTALEAFGPIWNSARLRLGRASWGTSGLEPFLTQAVPYAGTSSGRLSEDAVQIFLASAPARDSYRILELGAGSGVFAKLFLDRLRDHAPEIYHKTTYVVTDGSETVLAAQQGFGVLDDHAAQIEYQVLDACSNTWASGEYDMVLGSYVLDSLPFDLLAVKDGDVWRKEARCVVEDAVCQDPGALKQALAEEDDATLAPWQWIAPHLGMQTRHTRIERTDLEFGDSLPLDTGAEAIPFVHCDGALACVRASVAALRPGGVAVFSDYGHLAPLPRYEYLEFQTYGNSIAVGVNFFQLAAAVKNWPGAILYSPAKDAGNLHTRVIQKADSPEKSLEDLVDALYGAAAFHAHNDPLEKARQAMKSRYFEGARTQYMEALSRQPYNWAIMDELASVFLMATDDHEAAVEMADQGLERNPISPGLWRAKGDALVTLGRLPEARAALEQLVALAPALASTWRSMAELSFAEADYENALYAVTTGLIHDLDCDEQDELLDIQKNVLKTMAMKRHRQLTATANQMRALDILPI